MTEDSQENPRYDRCQSRQGNQIPPGHRRDPERHRGRGQDPGVSCPTISEKIGLDVDMWESNWDELKKHPGYSPVEQGYEGRPNIVATLEGHRRRPLTAPQRPHRRYPGREGRRLERQSVVGEDQGRPHLRARLLRHEERRREPHPGGRILKSAGVQLKGDVLIDIVIDEEVSGHGTLDTVIRGYTADAGISGETSGLAVQPACIGRIWFEIEIQGKPAGIQRRYQGVSGIELGYKIVKAVEALEAKRVATVKHPLYPKRIDSLPCMIGASMPAIFRALSRPRVC